MVNYALQCFRASAEVFRVQGSSIWNVSIQGSSIQGLGVLIFRVQGTVVQGTVIQAGDDVFQW